MKKILLGFIFILTVFGSFAQTNYQKGVIRGSASDKTTITRMEFDNYDYHIIFGKFYDSVHVAPFTPTTTLIGGSSGGNVHNAFFSVYDPSANLVFAHKLGNTTDSVTIQAATFNNYGDVAIVGSFKGSVDFADNAGNPYILTSVGSGTNGFIAYYDYMGNFNSAVVLECTSGNAIVNDVRFNINDEIVVVGQFSGTIDLDPSGNVVPLTATATDGFVATYSSYISSYISSAHFAGAGNQIPTHVLTDYSDIIIGGHFTNQFDFDFSAAVNSTPSNGNKDIFLLHTLQNYTIIDSILIGGAGNDLLKDWVQDGSGYKLLMDFEQTVNFNPQGVTTNLTSGGLSDVVVGSYGKNFEFGFVKKFGNTNSDKGHRLVHNSTSNMMQKASNRSINPNNDLIMTMGFSGTVDFNPDPVEIATSTSTNTARNSAVINLDSSGTYLRHGSIEAESILGYRSAGMDGNNAIMAGNFAGTDVDMLVFSDTSTLSHSGVRAGFYVHYNRCLMEISKPYFVDPYECGTCTAELGVSVLSGGMAPYDYYWSNGDYYSYDEYATGVCPDNINVYSVTVTDFYACSVYDTIWVKSHPTGFELDVNLNVIQTSCGNNFGSANASPINNLGNVSYLWSNGSTNSTADSLEVGNYFLQMIDDSLNCYLSKNFFIDNSDGPMITLNSALDAACGNVDNGSIDVTVSGGVAPYTYHWTNGATTEDLTGIAGGTYTLTVTDATGCENSLCITIYQPQEIQAYQTSTAYSNCGFSTGMMTIEAYGGDSPYTYLWDANAGFATNDTVYNLASGIYGVTVTDSLGCSANFKFGVTDSEWWAPSSYYNFYTNPDCSGAAGYIDISSYTYSAMQIMTYLWDTGETTEDLTNASAGIHYLQITDDGGCKDVSSYWLDQILPVSPTICMVTVDSTGTQNVVVWDKSTTPEADYYNIYREGFCNQYDFGIVGSVDFDSLSVFYDTVVNSDTRTWRYYVTTVDTCGFESTPSEIHRTIHLTSQVDADTNIVLDWSSYQGMQILGYKVYRRQPAGILFDYVDSVGPLTTNYLDTIDFNPYVEVEYFVDAIPASVCNATRAYNQNEARSNHSRNAIPKDTSTISVSEVIMETSIELYPNPTNDMVNLKVSSESKNWKIQLLDQTGRVVLNGQVRERAAFSTKDIQSGVYFIRMASDKNEIHTMKLMIVH